MSFNTDVNARSGGGMPTRTLSLFRFFFFNDTATTEIYTLSLHDALPISRVGARAPGCTREKPLTPRRSARSEEHTSELQSRFDLVCRLLLEKKNNIMVLFFFFILFIPLLRFQSVSLFI